MNVERFLIDLSWKPFTTPAYLSIACVPTADLRATPAANSTPNDARPLPKISPVVNSWSVTPVSYNIFLLTVKEAAPEIESFIAVVAALARIPPSVPEATLPFA